MTFAAYYTQFTNAYKLLRSSFTVVPTIPGSRLSLIGQILLPQHVLHSFVHSLMGVLVFWSCTVLSRGPYQSLAVPCNTDPRWVSLEQIIVIIQRLSYAWMCLVLVIFFFFFFTDLFTCVFFILVIKMVYRRCVWMSVTSSFCLLELLWVTVTACCISYTTWTTCLFLSCRWDRAEF